MNRSHIPIATGGGGLLLGGLLVLQVISILLADVEIAAEAVATILSVIPFILILLGGSYWLDRSDLDSEWYVRISGWILVAGVFFVVLFGVIALATAGSWLVRFGILHWAISVGAGIGLLIGIFEARSVENALEAEQARVRTEELRKQNERLDNIAGTISHDLRNPLTVAGGNIELLQDDYDDDRLETTAEMLVRMDDIIEDTLTLARSGQVISDPGPVVLTGIAEQAWRSVETEQASFHTEAKITIIADSDRVRQLLENLFRNAVEHGGDDVSVRIGPLENGFYVEDTGPGISEANRDSVFDTGYSTSEGGTGFGLAIIKQISDAHGWEISVAESTEGGARFEITGVEFAE